MVYGTHVVCSLSSKSSDSRVSFESSLNLRSPTIAPGLPQLSVLVFFSLSPVSFLNSSISLISAKFSFLYQAQSLSFKVLVFLTWKTADSCTLLHYGIGKEVLQLWPQVIWGGSGFPVRLTETCFCPFEQLIFTFRYIDTAFPMALSIAGGEPLFASSDLIILRFLNQALDSIKQNVLKIFASVLCCDLNVDSDIRDDNGLFGDSCPLKTENWFSKKDFDNKGDPQAVFNILDAMLKDSLERLKSMRESISLGRISFTQCTLDLDYTRHIALIKDLCFEGKLGAALWLRRKMIQKGVFPDVLTHNYLVNQLCKTGEMDKADWLIREMIEMGPSPNCATYNTFIKGYCLMNNVDKALYLFSTMTNSGVKPDRVTCNILVHALCKRGLLNDAVKLLEEILGADSDKAASDMITSTILMDGSFRIGNTAQALSHWDEMLEKNTERDVVAYNVLIHGFCLSREINTSYKYFCEMLKLGLPPDVFTYNTLISTLCREGRFDEACYIHSAMSRSEVAPDQITYKMIIQGLCIDGNVLKANDFLLSMLEKSIVPEPLIWNLVINGYARCGDIDNASSIRDKMLAHGVAPNVYTFNALIHAQVKGGNINDAYSLKKQMILSGIFPDVVTYNLLIGAACKLGHIYFALQLYDEMVRRGCEPDIITYTELIRGHCGQGNTKEAEELLVKIQKSGLVVDHVPFQILIKKYCKMREPHLAFYLYQRWLIGDK